ncbi:MAG: energy transducer TonB [Bacteroidia bacterium]
MITNLNSIENFNELVFENRHKAYGAYVIRKSYNNNVAISLALSIAFFGLLALGAAAGSRNNNGKENKQIVPLDSTLVIPVNLPHDEIKDPEIKKTDPAEVAKPKTDIINYKVDEHAKPDSAVTTNADSKITPNGDTKGKDTTATVPVLNIPTGDKTTKTNTTPAVIVDHMPQFDGDVYKFIKDHIKYPVVATENGTSGLVVLSFIVEKDGSIKSINTLKGVPDGCTEEAIRVVNLMPKWKPGTDHGEPMRVVINLPISFKLK